MTAKAFALDWDDNGRRFRGYAEIINGKATWVYDIDDGQGNPDRKITLRECRSDDSPAKVRAEIEEAALRNRLVFSAW